ncbi:MAG TPA: hypothetical protein VFA41_13260 [Ktedonobacteraceae bacterium]|jgi:hypothetical protein|nr:hypothetical protein [Ktedonobacteraceae bacterium]
MLEQVGSQAKTPTKPARCVARTSKDFVNGVCSGYLEYYFTYQDKALSDQDVYAFLVQNLLDAQGTDVFNAGYCTGWIEALLEDREVLQ